jgi:hypothetical protein
MWSRHASSAQGRPQCLKIPLEPVDAVEDHNDEDNAADARNEENDAQEFFHMSVLSVGTERCGGSRPADRAPGTLSFFEVTSDSFDQAQTGGPGGGAWIAAQHLKATGGFP